MTLMSPLCGNQREASTQKIRAHRSSKVEFSTWYTTTSLQSRCHQIKRRQRRKITLQVVKDRSTSSSLKLMSLTANPSKSTTAIRELRMFKRLIYLISLQTEDWVHLLPSRKYLSSAKRISQAEKPQPVWATYTKSTLTLWHPKI